MIKHKVSRPSSAPAPALPPWHPTCAADKDSMMRAWVNEHLDDQDAAFDIEQMEIEATQDWGRGTSQEDARYLWLLASAKAKAWRDDDVSLLRELHPDHAEFIHPRKRKRGQRRRPRGNWIKRWRLREAIEDVRRIRDIWAQHYGRRNRPKGAVTAEEIAAERHGLTEDEVRSAMNHSARRAG